LEDDVGGALAIARFADGARIGHRGSDEIAKFSDVRIKDYRIISLIL
jgi:hypothetical protein